MATAREKLAALRGASAPAPERLSTPLADAQGGAAEVKRRAAAGEPIVQSGLRPATTMQNVDAYSAAALGAAVDVVGGAAGILTDAVTMNVRGPRAGLKALREGKGIAGARQAIADAAMALPASRAVTEFGDTVEQTMRRASNVPDEVQVAPLGKFTVPAPVNAILGGDYEPAVIDVDPSVVRLGLDVALPGPEAALLGKASRAAKSSRVIEELVDTAAKVVDDVPASADAEMLRLADEAGRAQEAARLPVKAEPAPPQEVSLSRMIADELDARDRTVQTEAGGTLTDDVAARRARTPPPDAPEGAGGANGPEPLPKYARPSAINLERLNAPEEAKRFIDDTAKAVDDPVGGSIAEDLAAVKGEPLTHAEVQAAQARGRLLTEPETRGATLDLAADILHSRNRLVEMAKAGRVTPEYLELQKAVSTKATQLGRLLNTLGIRAGDDVSATAIKEVTEQLEALGKTSDEITEALKDVDFSDPVQATKAYQQHIKPKWGALLDAYRYTNLLSSPRTHAVNLTSNLIQAAVVRPADLLASGAVDWLQNGLRGKARTRYVSDVKPYARGLVGAYPKAVSAFFDAMSGKVPIGQLDLAKQAAQESVPTVLKVIPRLLDGIDRFTVKLIEGGEFERLAAIEKKAGRVLNEAEISKKATATAKEYAFRKELDPKNESGHGALLSTIDEFTSRVSHVLNTRVAGAQPLRWAVPFIQTPMNIFKAGIEHSPIGFATAYKSTRKTEQIGKALTGTAVFMGAGVLAINDRTTWAPPRNAKDRATFYAAGYQPYALKVGDEWVSYTKLGPLAYPIALAAAMKYQAVDNPEASGKMDVALAGRIIGSLGEFFSDQSYMQGLGDIINGAKGDESVMAKTLSNLASQLVPLSSLQRWVAQIVDPVYRKSSREFSIDGIIQNLKRNIPFVSKSVPPQLGPNKQPSVRQMPVVNAFSPVGITTEDPAGAIEYKGLQQRRRNAAIRKRAKEKE